MHRCQKKLIFIETGPFVRKSISYTIIILSLFICCKKQLKESVVISNSSLPLLYKTLDTTLSNQFEDRVFYYYAANGNCDSIISEMQLSASPPTWSYLRLRYEYANSTDTLPRKIYRKDRLYPEEVMSFREYDGLGKLIKYSGYTDTTRCAYDANSRLSVDSQFNSFNVWEFAYIYSYDARDNVSQWKSVSALSTGTSTTIFTYDSSVNPYNNSVFKSRWNPLQSAQSISPNNITSQKLAGSSVPPSTITYLYNSYNLPDKAYFYKPGVTSPYKIRTYFYR